MCSLVSLQAQRLALSSLKNTGSTTKWRKIRAAILKRDMQICQLCGAHATHVDHIIPRRLMQGQAADHPDNLQSLCKMCNLSKGGGFFDRRLDTNAPLGSFTPETVSQIHNKDV